MIAVWVAVAVLAVVVAWLFVDTRRMLGEVGRVAARAWQTEQTVAILTERVVRGGDGRGEL